MHEGATNNGWIIKTLKTDTSAQFIDVSDEGKKIIYRDSFVNAIRAYIDNYKQQILDNKSDINKQSLRDNLCRKFDSLCMIQNDKTVKWWD